MTLYGQAPDTIMSAAAAAIEFYANQLKVKSELRWDVNICHAPAISITLTFTTPDWRNCGQREPLGGKNQPNESSMQQEA